MDSDYEEMGSLDDLPVNVKVFNDTLIYLPYYVPPNLELTMTNQGMSLREWIRQLCSIPDKDIPYTAEIYLTAMTLDTRTLRNDFPKLEEVLIGFREDEEDESDNVNVRNVLREFLSNVQNVKLCDINFEKSRFIQHIGISSLKDLYFYDPINMNFDYLFTLNAESCTIETDQIPLRDLNRFFKLWMKGSNPKLKKLMISCDTEITPDWNVLLKGLRAEEAEAARSKKFFIINCRGIRAEIEVKHLGTSASVTFNVSKSYL
ncbi:hypothetical protein B9Z55_011277 [Caenorhabditis nigoni]|nr:hypothetical protein B9Z55_011277 [Caenorhabditis nigoni]